MAVTPQVVAAPRIVMAMAAPQWALALLVGSAHTAAHFIGGFSGSMELLLLRCEPDVWGCCSSDWCMLLLGLLLLAAVAWVVVVLWAKALGWLEGACFRTHRILWPGRLNS